MTTQKKFVDVLRLFIFKYTISAILIVFVMAIFLYTLLHFGVSKSLIIKFEEELIGRIQNEIKNTADHIHDELEEVKGHTELIRDEYSTLFAYYDDFSMIIKESDFDYHENGSYYKTIDNGGSSVYYSASTPINDYTIEKAMKTEWMDPIMKYVVETDEFVVQSYFNSFDNMNRLFPFAKNGPELFGPDLKITSHSFYFLADQQYNPDRKIIWTPPYYDPAGQGWMISCIAPVYNGDFLEGVVGLDVTINQLRESGLEISTLSDTVLFIIDENDYVIAINSHADSLLGIDSFLDDNGQIMENNDLKKIEDDQLRIALLSAIDSSDKQIEYNGDSYFLQKQKIDETNWELISLTNESYVTENIAQINKNVLVNAFIVLSIVFVLLLVILLVFRKKINSVAGQFSTPLETMALNAKHFGVDGKTINRIPSTGVEEIDLLNRELHIMSKEILNRSQKLIQAQIENRRAEQTIVAYHKEAITDELTQLYNRRKIDEVISSEVTRSRRYRSVFSVILLDIDYFKEINDKYGHQVGDEVLKTVAKTLRDSVRDTDIVSRWGGDEFLIVTIEADESVAFKLGEKIRLAILGTTHVKGIKVTSSIGVAEFNINKDDSRDILRKADIALYEAKNIGKNKVSCYREIGENHEF